MVFMSRVIVGTEYDPKEAASRPARDPQEFGTRLALLRVLVIPILQNRNDPSVFKLKSCDVPGIGERMF